jgi:pimeloyl-ACP methyl ester carboxylesterase
VSTFALVHGAWHGGWCWERLAPLLEARGHRIVAPDLPCDDSAATFDDYADVVVRALAGADDDVVVVGHSLAGNTIPLVAARRPVRRVVYLCALIAAPGVSFGDQVRAEPDMFVAGYERGLAPPDEERRRTWADYALARETMFPDCAEGDAEAAFARLRPQASAPYRRPCPLDAMPAVPSTYVLARQDRIVSPDWGRRAAPERLGVEPLELPGDHSPYLARPEALTDLLDAQARASAT